jgi:5-methyltetrahydropteroyltriglutamate--homocysteine methyltransferase
MTGTVSRILTTHTGSLPRPPALTRLLLERNQGKADDGALAKPVREAIAWVIGKQVEAGIDIGNDGEQQREHFFLHMQRRLTGFGGAWQRPQRRDLKKYPAFDSMRRQQLGAIVAVKSSSTSPPKAIGEIRYIEPGVREECRTFVEVLGRARRGFVEPFMTAPSPGIIAKAMANEYYPDEDAYFDALARALKREYEQIVESGLLLQIDAPDLALEYAVAYQDQPKPEFLRFVERSVAAINQALADVPRERVRLHVCWGNAEGPHDEDVPLLDIVSRLREARVAGFVLPFANPRHAHEYRLLPELLSRDQFIVAGVIDTTTNFIEHPEVVADRIERVAKAVGDPSRVMAGTDCGFDTGAGMGRVAEDVAWAKLASMAEGARLASSRLF